VFIIVYSRVRSLWQLLTTRGGEGVVARVVLWGDVFVQPCGASLRRQHLLLHRTCSDLHGPTTSRF
jgi:hypothetical protein